MHHHSVWYYFGGVSLFLFLVQVGSGALLLLYYKPTPQTAFESVQLVVTRVPFGWLIRSVHAWGANLMILAVFIHLASVYFLKAYRPPRELHWVSGCALFGLVLAFGFTGYLLPWNQLSFFATRVGTDIVGVVPGVGPFLRTYLRGGESVGGATLTRLFGMHVVFLPLLVLALLGFHLALVQRSGISEPLGVSRATQRYMPFYPHFLLRELAV